MATSNCKLYRSVDDPRGYLDEYPDVRQWRNYLRHKLFQERKGRSDLTQRLCGSFHLHEGIFNRTWLPKHHQQELLFAGPNCFVLSPDEHIPHYPDRTTCYWLSVVRYGKEIVDNWIGTLPFKANVSYPWRDSNGAEVLARIPDKYKVDRSWDSWYNSVYKSVNIEG